MFGDGLPADDAVFVGGQKEQQVVFDLAQSDGVALSRNGAGSKVDPQGVQVDDTVAVRVFAAEQGLDASAELGQVKGFGEIVVGAVIEAGDLVVQRVPRGDDDHAVLLF